MTTCIQLNELTKYTLSIEDESDSLRKLNLHILNFCTCLPPIYGNLIQFMYEHKDPIKPKTLVTVLVSTKIIIYYLV